MPSGYHELIVKGDEKLLRGFLWGYKSTRRVKSGLLLCDDYPIDTHHLRELLRLQTGREHLICTEAHHKTLVAAINRAAELGFEIISDEPIVRSYFEFKFDTFSEKVARSLKRIVRRLPKDLGLSGFDEKEDRVPGAVGVEMYAPAHDYHYYGGGTAEGGIEKLLSLHKKFSDHEFVDAKDIHVEH
ncbi:MAG: hypothetical protein ACE5EO_06630 [Candidatus Krumholzibacteriia bacterium]